MWTRFLKWIAERFDPEPRVISGRSGLSPYLSRYHVVGRPYMVDGSSPFDQYGVVKPGAVWRQRKWGLYIHCFHRSDDAGDLHSHPWRWARSLILSGGYDEERLVGIKIRVKRFGPGSFNHLHGDDCHRVDLIDGECWSIFLVGPKFSGWGFRLRNTGEFVPHREYTGNRRERRATRAEENDLDD